MKLNATWWQVQLFVQWLFKIMMALSEQPSAWSYPIAASLPSCNCGLGFCNPFTLKTDCQSFCDHVIAICNLPSQHPQKINKEAGREGFRLLPRDSLWFLRAGWKRFISTHFGAAHCEAAHFHSPTEMESGRAVCQIDFAPSGMESLGKAVLLLPEAGWKGPWQKPRRILVRGTRSMELLEPGWLPTLHASTPSSENPTLPSSGQNPFVKPSLPKMLVGRSPSPLSER